MGLPFPQLTPRQRVAVSLAVPHINAFAVSAATDPRWVIEMAFDEAPMACLLDATAPATNELLLSQIAAALPPTYPLAATHALPLPTWTQGWKPIRHELVADHNDPALLANLCLANGLGINPEGPQSVLIVAGEHRGGIASPTTLRGLRERLPNMRVVLASLVPLSRELVSVLTELGGAHLCYVANQAVSYNKSRARELHDVELTIAAAPSTKVTQLPYQERPTLRERDLAALFVAHASNSGRPFAMTVTGLQPPFVITALQSADCAARAPTAEELASALATPDAVTVTEVHDPTDAPLLVDGDLVLTTLSPHRQQSRVPLAPRPLVACAGSTLAFRIVDDTFEFQARGNVWINGHIPAPELWQKVNGQRMEIGSTLVSVVTRSIRRRYQQCLIIDGHALDLHRSEGNAWSLWHGNRRIVVAGQRTRSGGRADAETKTCADATDLNWLQEITQAQPLRGASRSAIPIEYTLHGHSPHVAVWHSITGTITFDLPNATARFAIHDYLDVE